MFVTQVLLVILTEVTAAPRKTPWLCHKASGKAGVKLLPSHSPTCMCKALQIFFNLKYNIFSYWICLQLVEFWLPKAIWVDEITFFRLLSNQLLPFIRLLWNFSPNYRNPGRMLGKREERRGTFTGDVRILFCTDGVRAFPHRREVWVEKLLENQRQNMTWK